MAVIHGRFGRVRITAATPTSTTDLAADLSTDGVSVIIADTTRRHWDPNSTLHRVYGATTDAVLTDAYTVDYVRGRIVFSTAHSTAVTYTVDAGWLPTSCLAVTKSWVLDVSNELIDATVFNCTAAASYRTFLPGLTDATIQLSRLAVSSESTGPPFIDRLAVHTPLFVELMPNATGGDKWECYARVQSNVHDWRVGELGQENITLKVDGPVYWTTAT